jgi:hypothetical protein
MSFDASTSTFSTGGGTFNLAPNTDALTVSKFICDTLRTQCQSRKEEIQETVDLCNKASGNLFGGGKGATSIESGRSEEEAVKKFNDAVRGNIEQGEVGAKPEMDDDGEATNIKLTANQRPVLNDGVDHSNDRKKRR